MRRERRPGRSCGLGRTEGHRFQLPITQQVLADAASLSGVHVNRTLMRLREDRVIEWSQKTVRILDPEALRGIARFDPDCLHRSGEPAEPKRLASTSR